LQFCVLGFGLLQDGNVGVGVFPEDEEVLVGGERTDAGSIGVSALRGFRFESVRTRNSQTRQRSRPAVPDDAAVVENLLKLGSGSIALSNGEIHFAANVGRIEAGEIGDEADIAKLNRASYRLQSSEGCSRILLIQHHLRPNRWQPQRLYLRMQREALVEVLYHRFCSCRIARHGKRQCGFHPYTLTRGNELESFRRQTLCLDGVAESSFADGSIFLPDRAGFLAVGTDGGI
jgi:hypothetical protein